MRIPTFGPEGQRRRALLLEDLLVLESRKMVFLSRQIKNGKVLSAHFYGESRHPYCRPKAGTKYSFRENVGDGKVWQHKRLPYSAMNAETGHTNEPQIVDLLIRALFSGPAYSCLVSS
jgi:hypothetical protein